MDHRRFGEKIAADYDRGAEQYRVDDEIEAASENHQRIGGNIRRLCYSFDRPIRVLELGCGTGRYFHWIRNAQSLVGTDLSAVMLQQARHPVLEAEVLVKDIRLMQANLYDVSFEPRSFDLIYSMGVFGYGAALTPELCARIASWLSADGCFYFDAIEQREMGRSHALKRSVKSAVVPFLPGSMRQKLAAREASAVPVIVHTRAEMERVLSAAGFVDYTLSSNTCHSPLWQGMHLESVARKHPETLKSEAHSPAHSRARVEAEPLAGLQMQRV